MGKRRLPKRRNAYPFAVQTRIDEDHYNRLVRACDAEGTTIAQYLRRLIFNHVPGGL